MNESGGAGGVAGGGQGGTAQTGGSSGSAGQSGGTGGTGGGSGGSSGSGGDAGGAAGASGACATTMTLNAIGDTYIESNPPNSTHGSETFLEVLASASTAGHRALTRFDLSQVPGSAKVLSAKLDLSVTLFQSATHDVGAHRATQAWVEADTSWTKYSAAGSWTSPGGDYVPTPTSHIVIGPSTKVGNVITWDVTADVQGVAKGSFGNNGWVLLDENAASLKGEQLQFASREAADPISRPKLRVSYCP